jgi:Domain of unknown function DUF29
MDCDKLADEIADVGQSQLRAVEFHLIQSLLHYLKAEAWPQSRGVLHWRAEARGQRDDARSAFTPSMAQSTDMSVQYRRALRRLPETINEQPPLPVPETCPVTSDELLAEL